jgi:uncharacterized protein YcbX
VSATVSQLNVYPVKSLRGIALESARVTGRGLEHDRRFMVVGPDGGFFTQREIPRMATVWTDIAEGELRLAAPDHDEISLPLVPADGERMRVEVWETECEAIAPSPDADRWLTDYLGRPCRLVYMPDSTRRISDPRHAGPGRLVGFADGYAFLVVSEASLAALNARLAHPVPMNRFRANIVVAGTPGFAEDDWGEFAAGSAVLRMAKPCGRCQITTTDQATGEVTGPEPLLTLGEWRRSEAYGARFAMNAVTVAAGEIRVGDPVVLRGS